MDIRTIFEVIIGFLSVTKIFLDRKKIQNFKTSQKNINTVAQQIYNNPIIVNAPNNEIKQSLSYIITTTGTSMQTTAIPINFVNGENKSKENK